MQHPGDDTAPPRCFRLRADRVRRAVRLTHYLREVAEDGSLRSWCPTRFDAADVEWRAEPGKSAGADLAEAGPPCVICLFTVVARTPRPTTPPTSFPARVREDPKISLLLVAARTHLENTRTAVDSGDASPEDLLTLATFLGSLSAQLQTTTRDLVDRR